MKQEDWIPYIQKKGASNHDSRGSIEALQVENERLRMESAYKKKANALVQNKKQSPNKTKPK